MATDATGAPTPLGIPKYNTSADAPSGLGFNAAMDSIDALISARVAKPASPSVGDALIWNGSTWSSTKAAGYEWAYGSVASNVSITTFGNAALANTIASATWTHDGGPTLVEFFSIGVQPASSAGATIRFWLFDGSGVVRHMGSVATPAAGGLAVPVLLKIKYTPGSGSKTLSVRADLAGVNSAGLVLGGDLYGLGVGTDTFIRVVKE